MIAVWILVIALVAAFIVRPGCPAHMHDTVSECSRCGWKVNTDVNR